MGNIPDKQEYTLINNSINCENTEIITTKSINETIICKDIINDIAKSNNVSDVFKNYDDKTIINYYKSESVIDLLKLNNDKSLQLANAIPKNKEKINI